MKPLALPLLLALGSPASGTPAQTTPAPVSTTALFAADPQAIADALRNLGYRAELTTDASGDPKIRSAAAGANFAVYFYGCTAGANCISIQFSAGFDLAQSPGLAAINEWNRTKRYGKAYLDEENDPYIEMDVNMAGGLRRDTFESSVKLWDDMLARFQRHIDF